MCRQLALLVLTLGFCLGLPASAANIVWVSFHTADDTPSSGAAGTGFTTATDKGYTDLLKANGYNVTRYVTTATPDAALLNAADLVIVSRSVGSANYQDAAATTWNTTITNIDSQAQATFNLAKGNKCLDVRSAKSHKKIESLYVPRGCASDSDYRGWYPYDCYWSILRSWHLMGQERIKRHLAPDTTMRPLNIAIA